MSRQNCKTTENDDIKKEVKKVLSELKELIQVAVYLGIKTDNEQRKQTIKSAVESVKDNDLEGTLGKLEETCDFLKDKIDEKVDRDLEEIESRKSKLSDKENLDLGKIDRNISKIKKGTKKGTYKKIPDLLFQAWNELKKKEDEIFE